MLSQLQLKLAIPQAIIGIAFLVIILTFDLSTTSLALVMGTMIALQTACTYYCADVWVAKRLVRLQKYLDLVVSTEQAPEKPLTDKFNDPLGRIVNQLGTFIDGLGNVISEIRHESESLRQGAAHLSSQVNEAEVSVADSVTQMTQMAESIEQVASTSAELSQSADQVSQTTAQVVEILSQGTHSSNTNKQSIEAIAAEVDDMSKQLALLQEESSNIGSVLDVIRGIADQTNLLALNAAIEAARAGEQGRGFAVVADEVRALAHRTQEATVEIQSMVEGLQEKSVNAVTAIGRGQELSQQSMTHSEDVVQAMSQIANVFEEVDQLTSQIADGTSMQQASTGSLNDNMSVVVSVNQQISDNLTQVSQTSKIQHKTSDDVDNTLNKICV